MTDRAGVHSLTSCPLCAGFVERADLDRAPVCPRCARGAALADWRLEAVEAAPGAGVARCRARSPSLGPALLYVARRVSQSAGDAAPARLEQSVARLRSREGAPLHPGLALPVACGVLGQLPFVAMQAEGLPSIGEVVARRGPLAVADVVQAGLGPAGALVTLAREGVTLTTIRPKTLLLGRGGQGALLAAPLALLEEIAGPGPGTAHVGGGGDLDSLVFCAREEAFSADPRSDLYSLAAVLRYALTGRPPFRARTTLELFHQLRSAAPEPLREARPDVPEALGALLDRAMAKDPADRGDAQALYEGLRALG